MIFWISVICLSICIWTLTIGQSIDYEFQDKYRSCDFYYYIFLWTPVFILLTLFGTVKKNHSVIVKIIIIVATILSSVACFFVLINYMFMIGFGAWETLYIKYENKSNPEHQIRKQIFDVGAFGYGSTRVLEIKPFAILFWEINEIDTSAIDKTKWILVNKEVNIRLP